MIVLVSINTTSESFSQVSQDCVDTINKQLDKNKVLLNERPIDSSVDISEIFCPTIHDIDLAFEILYKDYNKYMRSLPGGKKYHVFIENVESYFDSKKIQILVYRNRKNQINVYLNVIDQEGDEEGISAKWREFFIIHLSEGNSLVQTLNINLDSGKIN